MAVINILTPSLKKNKFSGGIFAIFNYADGLSRLGHEVNIIPIAASHYPKWFKYSFNIILLKPPIKPFLFLSALANREWETVRKTISSLMTRSSSFSSYSFQRAGHMDLIRNRLPSAEITLSTSYETALPNFLYGKGKRFYFVQHFEPLFAAERENKELSYLDAISSYRLPGLSIIANSSWLAKKVEGLIGREIPVCLNAISPEFFKPVFKKRNNQGKIVVLSYGGRHAEWKGIHDAAEAIRKARDILPQIEWRVFGDSLLSPYNPVAPYIQLGYLTGEALKKAYAEADIMLCTSWYESFPLYPLEAMACGTAVISTPFGTEDYLTHMRNGYLVTPKNTEEICAALTHLGKDNVLRRKLSNQAMLDAKRFTWDRSVLRMAYLIGLNNNNNTVSDHKKGVRENHG